VPDLGHPKGRLIYPYDFPRRRRGWWEYTILLFLGLFVSWVVSRIVLEGTWMGMLLFPWLMNLGMNPFPRPWSVSMRTKLHGLFMGLTSERVSFFRVRSAADDKKWVWDAMSLASAGFGIVFGLIDLGLVGYANGIGRALQYPVLVLVMGTALFYLHRQLPFEEPASVKAQPGFLKRIGRSNRLFPRKLKFTKEGKLLIGITLGIGFAAINTGNNLMYLVLGMLLSLMVVSGILSELTLKGVTAERIRRGPTEAEKEEFFGFRIKNTKSFFVSYCVELEEVLDVGTQVSGYALKLSPGEELVVRARIRVEDRGVHSSAGLSIATRFPFSIFKKSRYLPEAMDVVVTPALREVDPITDESNRVGIEEVRPRVGRGEELYGLKEYRHGDPPKDIHWKATAKRRKLTAREYESPGNKTVWLCFFGTLTSEEMRERYEDALRYLASIADTFLQGGGAVGLVTTSGVIQAGTGDRHRLLLLSHLAHLNPEGLNEEEPTELPNGGRRILIQMEGEKGAAALGGIDEILIPRFVKSEGMS